MATYTRPRSAGIRGDGAGDRVGPYASRLDRAEERAGRGDIAEDARSRHVVQALGALSTTRSPSGPVLVTDCAMNCSERIEPPSP